MTTPKLRPTLDSAPRKQNSDNKRDQAARVSRAHVDTEANSEFDRYKGTWPTSFTKGLPHNANGIVEADAFNLFVQSLNHGNSAFDVPLGPCRSPGNHRPTAYVEKPDSLEQFLDPATELSVRGWESPNAGHVYDLEGPDAGSVGMAPAPELGSDELAAEMAENYAMAWLRDTEFEDFRGTANSNVNTVVEALGAMSWFNSAASVSDASQQTISQYSARRRAARFNPGESRLSAQSLFRGSSFGCMAGPYISQFLFIGNPAKKSKSNPSQGHNTPKESYNRKFESDAFKKNEVADGYINYGAQRIDQRVNVHEAGVDYLTDWASWLDVQNGADTRGNDKFRPEGPRFLTTPRDLATYVHFDALYQAYLNACLFLLAIDAQPDRGFPEGGSHNTRSAFATFGGPHVLTLVTETATRSLKAVRRQKYNFHLRARPEVVGAIAALACSDRQDSQEAAKPFARKHVEILKTAIDANNTALLDLIHRHNTSQEPSASALHRHGTLGNSLPDISAANYLLPMAFPEGSPMHPAYGAGHATVAGSCVTMLKAFFETFKSADSWEPLCLNEIGIDKPIQDIYVPAKGGDDLKISSRDKASDITLIGELNKLAANISIGRNMAGVHFYSDYYDSLRMGERIAVGMLQEQMYTYPEAVTMRLMSFDDDKITITATGNDSKLSIVDSNGNAVSEDEWFSRHVTETTTHATAGAPSPTNS